MFFPYSFVIFFYLCQFCCSAGVLPAWPVYTHCHREKTESRIYIKILNEHPVYKQIYLHNLRSVETGALQLSSRKRVVIENTEYRVSHNYLSYYSGSGNNSGTSRSWMCRDEQSKKNLMWNTKVCNNWRFKACHRCYGQDIKDGLEYASEGTDLGSDWRNLWW